MVLGAAQNDRDGWVCDGVLRTGDGGFWWWSEAREDVGSWLDLFFFPIFRSVVTSYLHVLCVYIFGSNWLPSRSDVCVYFWVLYGNWLPMLLKS